MQTCPRCQRVNPDEAAYCHFDGANLRDGSSAAPPSNRLPHEFVFSSGRHCKTYDEFALGCQDEWSDASELLQQGVFRQFFTSVGRLDLARAAEEARKHPDADVALDTFLVRLPVAGLAGPRLELEPRRVSLGTLRSGETMETQLRVVNLGKGLLLGTIAVTGGEDWLRIVGATAGTLQLKALRDQVVTLSVNTKDLAAPADHHGRLTVITNGGIVEVAVLLTAAAHPFPHPPYKGAGSPRDLAVRIRGNPKPAVALLEGGEVTRWFKLNGWPYPVNGPAAQGMAAVQQFFEGMGLAKPPALQLTEPELRLRCRQSESVLGQTTVHTPDRKWVYGRAVSEVPWIRFTTPNASGPQRATLYFEVDSSELTPGSHEGVVKVIANLGTTLTLRVSVEVTAPHKTIKKPSPGREFPDESHASKAAAPPPARTKPVTVVSPPPPPREEPTLAPPVNQTTRRWPLGPVVSWALIALLLRLLLAGPADIYARVLTQGTEAGTAATWRQAPVEALFVRHFVLATWWVGALAGVVILSWRGSRWIDIPCGLIAGAATGVAAGGTVACILPLLDAPARVAWRGISPLAEGAGAIAATGLWLVVAVASWTVLGAVSGLVVAVVQRRPWHARQKFPYKS
ncbi:MAG: hypothetical protein K2R98_13115 [Gemmataceae bacterium]|nr:hypothetical protein [Gemmataceae bacterium]